MSEKQKSDCPGYYEVSGYTTDSGKKVDSYTRSCWKHGAMNIIDSAIKNNFNQANNTFQNNYLTPHISTQYNDINYQNYPLTTFNAKKTEVDIKNSMKNIEGLLKQKIITKEDITRINNQTQTVMYNLFDDIEDLSVQKSNLSKIPTVESIEEAQKIEKDRKQIRENAYQTILMLYQQRNVVEKQWKNVSTKEEDYDNKFNQYVANKQEIEKLSDTVKDLFDYASKIDDTTLEKVKKLRDELGLMRFRPMLPKKQAEQHQKWIWPCKGIISSEYGWRIHPIFKNRKWHNGIDIANKQGTIIVAPADGKAYYVGYENQLNGNTIRIDHGLINDIKVESVYIHLKSFNIKSGDMVKQGQIIGFMGSTGNSTGPHLHFSIYENKRGNDVNPFKYIDRTKY